MGVEKIFKLNSTLNFVNVFLSVRYFLPLKNGGALQLNRFESPAPKGDLCQVWLKLA